MSDRIRVDSEEREEPSAPVEPTPPPATDPPPDQRPPEPPSDGDIDPAPEVAVQRDYQKRLDQLTREKYDAQRQRDEYGAALQRYAQQQPQQPQYQPPTDPHEIGRQQGLQEAREQEFARRFNEDCNILFAKGQQEFGDMTDAVSALNAVGYGSRPDALMAITQLPDGHRVYRELAQNLDNAARILQMPPMQMAVELARMSRGPEASQVEGVRNDSAPVSRAPAPLRPVGGNSGRAERPLDQVSMAEFIRRRDRDERRSRISR